MPTGPDTLLQALRWRYATKAFDASRRIDAPTWEALEQGVGAGGHRCRNSGL